MNAGTPTKDGTTAPNIDLMVAELTTSDHDYEQVRGSVRAFSTSVRFNPEAIPDEKRRLVSVMAIPLHSTSFGTLPSGSLTTDVPSQG